MVYYTGDTHGDFSRIQHAIHADMLKPDSTIVILGDAGLNYYGNQNGDSRRKRELNKMLKYHHLIKPKPIMVELSILNHSLTP